MQNGVNAADSNPPATFSESQERRIVWLLCLLAAVHVFVFSAAAPFFSTVDEQIHFDLAVKYSQGHVPRALELVSARSGALRRHLWHARNLSGSQPIFPPKNFPPPWTQPMDKIRPDVGGQEGGVEQGGEL